jgi:CheY-like chemotaxis protein
MSPLPDRRTPTPCVLIIDDNAVNRRLAQVLFQKLGWQGDTLDSGACALVHLATHHYDLILLDINMPGMNGLDVCRHLRADPRLRDVRVLAYTAHVLPAEQQHVLASGFDAVLLKPISFRVHQEMVSSQTPCR